MWGTESERAAFAALLPVWAGPAGVRDRKGAIPRIRALAEAGYAPAQCALAEAYATGEGVRRSDAEAFRLYRLAADKGYPSAVGAVGNYYLRAVPAHDLCPYDPVQAAEWHLRSAREGNAGSQYNLAFSYWDGRGVGRDPAEAYVWASLAVHCSPARLRPAEALRDQASAALAPDLRPALDVRIAELAAALPHPWSEHLAYWRALAAATGDDGDGAGRPGQS